MLRTHLSGPSTRDGTSTETSYRIQGSLRVIATGYRISCHTRRIICKSWKGVFVEIEEFVEIRCPCCEMQWA